MSPGAGLDTVVKRKIPTLKGKSNPGRPGCSQSMYWLNSASS